MTEESLVIHKIFSNIVSQFPDKVALRVKRDNQWFKITYKDLEASSQKVATFLIREGLKKGDLAGIILENRPEWAIIYLGVMYAGLTCVPLDRQLTHQEIDNLLLDSGVRIIFCSYNTFSEKFKDNIQNYSLKFVLLDNSGYQHQNVINFLDIEHIKPEASLLLNVLPEDIASLIYTSGTTAKPKGVLLSHKNICSNFISIQKINVCFACDNILSILPLHHTYAFMVTLIVPLFLGAEATYCLSFKPSDLNQIIKEANVTVLVGVPQLFTMLHKAIYDQIKKIPFLLRFFLWPFIKAKVRSQFGILRLLVSGGARLEPKINRDLTKLGFKLVEGYGLTETSPVVTLNPPKKTKFGSVGKVIPGVQIKIFNPDKPRPCVQERGKSGVGQVLIKGPNVMLGYFKQPDLTNQVIKDGWFYSGDLGFIDSRGYLFLTGREKDMIVLSSGKNIYPEELEEYYSASPYIKEICILSRQEEKFGRLIESLYAIIVPDLEYFHQKKETNIRGKIRWELENLAKNAPSYKHIMGFGITKEELPRTALKKIKRHEVRKKYLEVKQAEIEIKEPEFCEEDKKILNLEIAKKIIHYISSEVKKPVCLDSHLEIDLSIDSLTRVELGLGLEALLSIKIPDELLYEVSTIKEVIINIQGLMGGDSAIIYKTEGVQKNWGQILRELPPQKEMLEKIRLEASLLDKLITLMLKGIFLFILRIFWCLKIKGKDFLPKQGPYLICPNHASYLDGLIVFSALPLRLAVNTYFVGYSDIFEHPLLKWSIKLGGVIPVDPARNFTEAMQAASFVCSEKKIVCIFPEGRRSPDGSIGEFKKGTGILIKELDIPVIPVYIKGSYQSWPRTRRLPRLYPLKIIFGKPIYWQKLIRKHVSEFADDYQATAQGLREEVMKLKC